MLNLKQQQYAAIGLFLFTLAVYFLLSPGRIDTTDSQVRFDATIGVLNTGIPLINNPYLEHTLGATRANLEGRPLVSIYAPASQLIYAPFLKVIFLLVGDNREVSQFWFSHINRIFSAAIIVLLFYFYPMEELYNIFVKTLLL